MATTQTPSCDPADLKARLSVESAGPTDIFGLSYIQLCGVAYDAVPADIPSQVATPSVVAPWGSGHWQCVWGPMADPDDANLVYVAAYYEAGLPVAAVVVVRGTDVTDDAWGDLKEGFEDLAAAYQVPLPWLLSPSDVRVADGTLDALTTIEALRWTSGGNDVGLLDFLTGFLGDPANGKPVLVVTGHSLGGCVTTVLAPWLAMSLEASGVSVPVVPCTFAAPTAGNAAFTQYLAGLFPYAPRYYNDLDAVPLAWADLGRIDTIYASYSLPTPLVVTWAVEAFEWTLGEMKATYEQPGDAGELNGSFCPGLDWYDQVGAQHDHNNYILLMKGESPTCPANARPRNRRWSPEEKQAALGGGGGSAGAASAAAGPPDPAGG